MAGYERLKSVGGGGRYDALADRRPQRRTPASASRSASPARSSRCSPTACSPAAGPVPSAVLVAARRRGVAARRATPSPTPCAPAASPARSRPAPQKFGKQIRYAERRGIPYVWFTTADGGHEVKDIRSGEQVAADPATWTPPAEDLRPQVTSTSNEETEAVIRTHDAGALRAEHVGQTVTLAGWVANRRDHGGVAFIDLREASGVVQVVIRDEEVAHQPAQRVLPQGHRRGDRAHGGQREPEPRRPATIEVVADDVEVLSAAAPLPFPISDHIDVGEEARLKHRYLDLRRTGPNARAPPAQQGQQGRARRARRATTSSRSRRRR